MFAGGVECLGTGFCPEAGIPCSMDRHPVGDRLAFAGGLVRRTAAAGIRPDTRYVGRLRDECGDRAGAAESGCLLCLENRTLESVPHRNPRRRSGVRSLGLYARAGAPPGLGTPRVAQPLSGNHRRRPLGAFPPQCGTAASGMVGAVRGAVVSGPWTVRGAELSLVRSGGDRPRVRCGCHPHGRLFYPYPQGGQPFPDGKTYQRYGGFAFRRCVAVAQGQCQSD